LIDSGQVAFDDTVTEYQIRLMNEGVDFQGAIEARAMPLQIESRDLPEVLAKESIRLFGVPVFENEKLEIYGKPDAIDTAQGALIPVEVKSHKAVQRSDELELAFYWLLQEPFRTRDISPLGYLLLRGDSSAKQVEIELHSHRFKQVQELIQQIRKARAQGVRPRICGCTVCNGVMRDKVDRATRRKKDLTLIWGIGRFHANHLEEIGIRTYEELLEKDSVFIVEKLRQVKCYVSSGQVDWWKHHAKSYSSLRPTLFGNPLKLNGRFLAIDFEYGGGHIWLVGFCLVSLGGREYRQLWADTPEQEKSNLKTLTQIAAANPSLPIITWNGNGADMPQLRYAIQRHRLGKALASFESKHFDLFHHVRKSIRFPIPKLSLVDVARFFAIPKLSRIQDGLVALSLYNEYRRSQDENRRNKIREDLVEYNRDDLEALVGVAEGIETIQRDSPKA
jgi:predicted RecB family nuclease